MKHKLIDLPKEKQMKRKPTQKTPSLFFDTTLDFHGYSGDKAVMELEERLCTAVSESILIIHGRGDGILKKRIRDYLAQSSFSKCIEYGEDLNMPGSDGVTVVHIGMQ